MDKIEQELKKQCQVDPDKKFNIILIGTLSLESAIKLGLDPIPGLDNMYKGKLAGQQILSIEKLGTIDSIEMDRSLNMLGN